LTADHESNMKKVLLLHWPWLDRINFCTCTDGSWFTLFPLIGTEICWASSRRAHRCRSSVPGIQKWCVPQRQRWKMWEGTGRPWWVSLIWGEILLRFILVNNVCDDFQQQC
jgi:hypothetical protein